MDQNAHSKPPIIAMNRLDNLVDGVFAIAMTILVLAVSVPTLKSANQEKELLEFLASNFHDFYNYAVSFLILGALWVSHAAQLRHLERTRPRHLWLNLTVLMLVCLVPFTTSLCGDYPHLLTARMLFHGNLLAVGIAMFVQWRVGLADTSLFKANDSQGGGRDEVLENLLLPIASLAGALAAIWIPAWSNLVYFVIPLVKNRLRK